MYHLNASHVEKSYEFTVHRDKEMNNVSATSRQRNLVEKLHLSSNLPIERVVCDFSLRHVMPLIAVTPWPYSPFPDIMLSSISQVVSYALEKDIYVRACRAKNSFILRLTRSLALTIPAFRQNLHLRTYDSQFARKTCETHD